MNRDRSSGAADGPVMAERQVGQASPDLPVSKQKEVNEESHPKGDTEGARQEDNNKKEEAANTT